MLDLLAEPTRPDAPVVVAAPGAGEGFWAGGPRAVAVDGVVWLAYRLRWVEALDADIPAALSSATRTMVLPGDEKTARKDVVVQADADGWRMWACRRCGPRARSADRGGRAYFERTGADGAHDLRTVYVARPSVASQRRERSAERTEVGTS